MSDWRVCSRGSDDWSPYYTTSQGDRIVFMNIVMSDENTVVLSLNYLHTREVHHAS